MAPTCEPAYVLGRTAGRKSLEENDRSEKYLVDILGIGTPNAGNSVPINPLFQV